MERLLRRKLQPAASRPGSPGKRGRKEPVFTFPLQAPPAERFIYLRRSSINSGT
jgi:hypothetical protein